MELHRLWYMQREYTAVATAINRRGAYNRSIVVLPTDDGSGYYGFVTVRNSSSPWFGGQFEFRIHVPKQYPAQGPKVTFPQQLNHPGLNDGFELDVQLAIDNLEADVSILSVVLKEIVALFDVIPTGDEGAELQKCGVADVDARSVVAERDAAVNSTFFEKLNEKLPASLGSDCDAAIEQCLWRWRCPGK
jgi:ubiquitin-protein ligase